MKVNDIWKTCCDIGSYINVTKKIWKEGLNRSILTIHNRDTFKWFIWLWKEPSDNIIDYTLRAFVQRKMIKHWCWWIHSLTRVLSLFSAKCFSDLSVTVNGDYLIIWFPLLANFVPFCLIYPGYCALGKGLRTMLVWSSADYLTVGQPVSQGNQ